MDDIIIIKDLIFKYDERFIFNRFNLNIRKGSFTSIIGPNGCGKSTLVKIILGLIKTDSYLNIDQLILGNDNIKDIRKRIGVVFENPDNQFVAETVMDDIAFSLENMKFKKQDIRDRIEKYTKYLGIFDLLEREPHRLSGGEKQLVALASALIIEPKILILDEALTMVDTELKEKTYKLLQELHQNHNITIINVTHDLEDSLYGEDIVVIDQGQVVLKGPKELVLKEEKILSNIGLDLPFMASLSLKLKYYDLVDDLILDMDEMVDVLWK
ncbi:MAG: ATP-binding cassette domain-containing protein [Bacilli bacterium]|nr:ATP-binding cassette domain-containing protein [Bacilli bacterium]MDD4809040.1 ATP-binding cassette domain-containing protein [Bacilli bacterium]